MSHLAKNHFLLLLILIGAINHAKKVISVVWCEVKPRWSLQGDLEGRCLATQTENESGLAGAWCCRTSATQYTKECVWPCWNDCNIHGRGMMYIQITWKRFAISWRFPARRVSVAHTYTHWGWSSCCCEFLYASLAALQEMMISRKNSL